MSEDQWQALSYTAGHVFTPGSPISERELFAGRLDQVRKLVDTITQRGYHAILYGERGVGKTSLTNVLSSFLQSVGNHFHLPKTNCDASDTFTSLWKKQLQDIVFSDTRPGAGFESKTIVTKRQIVDELPDELTPDIIRRTLNALSQDIVLVLAFDEYDRIEDKELSLLMADTIKGLSDYGVDATIILIGVAESVDKLIKEHQSIERVFVQIPLQRMSNSEIMEIIEKGMKKLGMTIDDSVAGVLVSLSQGLPYVTHLLSLYTARAALMRTSKKVQPEDLQVGITRSLENWQQSIKTAYYIATRSQQPGNIFKEVLLSCAFAKTDELGYFPAANVRDPLRVVIPDKTYDIPNFARHLKQFGGPERGEIFARTGGKRRLRYRFTNPLMRPFIILHGLETGIITQDKVRTLERLAEH